MTLPYNNPSKSDSQNQSQSKSRRDKKLEAMHISAPAAAIAALIYFAAIYGATLMKDNVSEAWIERYVIGMLLLATLVLFSLKVAQQWEKAVVLRLGKFHGLKGPGVFWLVPFFDIVSNWIDHRVMVTPFNAEKTLTKDTVPVDVDAVLFWVVWDAEKAALEVADYRGAIRWAAQTALREILGQMSLADILVGRAKMDADLQKIIDERTTPWGISVQSVEIRDVIIPQGLEDAMSRQAQAEREKQARIILGTSEAEIASKFVEAAKIYAEQPGAMQLRAMNIIYETTKERGATILIPSAMVDSMNPTGVAAVAMGLARQAPTAEK